jgi:4-aminobutyrate aminotransferase-like enzyme/Ser/Thr protein kinase RdoA (MazF antagonist)
MHLLQHVPQFPIPQVLDLARESYGLADCTVSTLPSERDQNLVITTQDGNRVVLKIANALESPAFLDAQYQVFEHLARSIAFCPRVIPTRTGAPSISLPPHIVRLVTYLPGKPLGTARRQSPELLRDLGRCLGTMDRVLSDFDHPACHRDFHWDLARGTRTVNELVDCIADVEIRDAVHRLAEQFERHVTPLAAELRRSVIHGDANDYNVLVDPRQQRVTGIIDFGDMVHSYTAGNLAVAAAYALLDKPDLIAAACSVITGYNAEWPLTEAEIAALFGLIGLRLCLSACLAVDQQQQRPNDDYLAISQAPLKRTLPKLLSIHPRLAEMMFRHTCGRIPCRSSESVTRWIQNQAEFASILDVNPRTAPVKVLDLSVGSPLVDGDERKNDPSSLAERIAEEMREFVAALGIGRYNEPRLLYTTPFFASGASLLDERRTIHLGLDFFTEPGSVVRAPLAGTVHATANNAVHQDYGPVVILKHETDEGQPFFTLYGHLSLESLNRLHVGQRIEAGEQLGTIGTSDVNGGWTPHLHFQIILDLLDLDCDFPGVALASQRAVWLSLSPDPNLIVRIPQDRFPRPEPTRDETMSIRRQRLGRNLSIAYRNPVKIVRGWMQYLFDEEGRRYIDAYNNVPHVGHCHPHVVEAARKQMGVLNTNTRYLHDLVNEYAERLCATLPEPLSVCYFLNSASEANELAIRLARTHTGRRDMIVLESAYHGHTNTLIDISPYKHAGPGGKGAPDWVHAAPIPDDYRGPFKRNDPHAGHQYADQVRAIVERLGQMCAFIAETCPSVGGQIMLPSGYLSAVYRDVRAAGGVCIADEVQTGFGRLGSHFWAFEAHGVVPDIVVMGKPMGNGHPLAAVVTTPAIADSFNNGMEFFSTFGGNTVSCAVGMAVLDAIREEQLQEHALRVGQVMLDKLRPFVDRHPLVGDVRGSGLFLGVELVRDRQTLEPAGEEASLVANRMREHGVLLGTDGPYHNVIKIRPPMPFSETDALLLVSLLDKVLTEEFAE